MCNGILLDRVPLSFVCKWEYPFDLKFRESNSIHRHAQRIELSAIL